MTGVSLSRLTAWLIAAYALDVLVPIIDIFGLPVPRYVASMSLSSGFILLALAALVPLARRQRVPLLGRIELALAGVIAFWAGLENLAATRMAGSADYSQVLDFVPPLLVIAATRLHHRLFGERDTLVEAFVALSAAMVAAHTALLVAMTLNLPLPMVRFGELRGRNAMAQLMPLCLWLLAFFPLRDWPVLGRRYGMLVVLGLLNLWLTSTRSAVLVMAWCVLVGVIQWFPAWRQLLYAALLPAGLLLVALAALAYPIAMGLGDEVQQFVGHGDNALSFWSRARTNFMLLEKLAEDPILGLGWREVAATRIYGYMGHTLYVNVLAAYGWIGALPVLLLAGAWLSGLRPRGREAAAHFIVLALMIESVFNNVFAFFGVPLALLGAARLQHLPELQEHGSKEIAHRT
ncbi:hypothetical protein [Ramlibacter sp.]|uniref:hypothetical protein n=1 Tax=Ramlibacter sp. TaxID=1917967 RepID=UPI002D46C24F|nr:hypothetical protein [Ramlibacter sp.]HYD75006.1 hypothetical protein [Ramlibacter sp.]